MFISFFGFAGLEQDKDRFWQRVDALFDKLKSNFCRYVVIEICLVFSVKFEEALIQKDLGDVEKARKFIGMNLHRAFCPFKISENWFKYTVFATLMVQREYENSNHLKSLKSKYGIGPK